MCNDYERVIAWKTYRAAMDLVGLAVPITETAADLPAADHVRITDVAPVIRAAGNGVELAPMRWSFRAPNGKPVFNFRSEGRSFAKSNRCLIPASAFYEFTGTKSPKTRHRFTFTGEPFMCIAGIWREAAGAEPEAFTMLTTAPGPDIAPIHDRQICVLKPDDWSAWIYLTKPEGELLRPLPAGSLGVG